MKNFNQKWAVVGKAVRLRVLSQNKNVILLVNLRVSATKINGDRDQ